MSTQPPGGFERTGRDRHAVDTACPAAPDAVRKAGSGRPGTAAGPAPAAYTTFQKVTRHAPADPDRTGHDRFVPSPGRLPGPRAGTRRPC
ncbi:hypothetical protein [Streptomyces sp. NPDC093094]|uniref:hypothetical protein n=1 Tax=Streptomyces sp. NPDC093094 TaxID=3366026 RepID=UPI00381C6A66